MEIRLARFLSHVLNPIIMTTYVFGILLYSKAYFALTIPFEAKWKLLLLVFLLTFLFPLFAYSLMLRFKLINNLDMPTRQERIFPFLFTAVFYYIAYYLLNNLQLSHVYQYFIFAAAFLMLICMFVNFFWKISIHMIGIGGATGIFFGLAYHHLADYFLIFLLAVIASGLVGYARLTLKAHTPGQVYAGFLTGFTAQFIVSFFF